MANILQVTFALTTRDMHCLILYENLYSQKSGSKDK